MRKYQAIKRIDLMDRDPTSKSQSRLQTLSRSTQRSINRQQNDYLQCLTDRNDKINQFSIQPLNQQVPNISLTNSVKNNIRTYIRFKPFSKYDIMDKNALQNGIDIEDANKVILDGTTIYSFDKIFDPEATQKSIYQTSAQQLIKSFVSGYNGTIFAYGQTGSGKTYTMFGGEENNTQGIIPRAIQDLFNQIQCQRLMNYKAISLSCSMFQIYKQNICDLMAEKQKEIKIMENSNGSVQIQNLTIKQIQSKQQIFYWINKGSQQRKIRGTDMNQRSSRSHLIFTLYLTIRVNDYQTRSSKLNLVDLAGSQKVSKTKVSGQGLQQAIKINLSLSCLGNTIYALSKGQQHVPFRDSKLTRVLQQSLSGNSITRVIVTCSMLTTCKDETISSLKFANRIKKIKTSGTLNLRKVNQPVINKFVYQTLKAQFQNCEDKLQKIKTLLGQQPVKMSKDQILDSLRSIVNTQQSQNQFLSTFSTFNDKLRSSSKGQFIFQFDRNQQKHIKKHSSKKQQRVLQLQKQIQNLQSIIKRQQKMIISQSEQIEKLKESQLVNITQNKTQIEQKKTSQKLKILRINNSVSNPSQKIKQVRNRFKQDSLTKQNMPITFRTKYEDSNKKSSPKIIGGYSPQTLDEIKYSINQIIKQKSYYQDLERQILLKQVKVLGIQVNQLRAIIEQTGNSSMIVNKKIVLPTQQKEEIARKKLEQKDKYIEQLEKLLTVKFKIEQNNTQNTQKLQKSKQIRDLRSSNFVKNIDIFRSPTASAHISRMNSAKMLHK